jgi:hypothetical protein
MNRSYQYDKYQLKDQDIYRIVYNEKCKGRPQGVVAVDYDE